MASLFFTIAVAHVLVLSAIFRRLAHATPLLYRRRIACLHFLGEAEWAFGLWALVWLLAECTINGTAQSIQWIRETPFHECGVVLVLMTLASDSAFNERVGEVLHWLSGHLPILSQSSARLAVTLWAGPLLGSLLTEPAAMTITAALLGRTVFNHPLPENLKYKILGSLLVNISVGGALTHFAAPPILLVASIWHWNTPIVFGYFGVRALLSVSLITAWALFITRGHLPNRIATQRNSSPVPRKVLLRALFVGIVLTTIVVRGLPHEIWLVFVLPFVLILVLPRLFLPAAFPSKNGATLRNQAETAARVGVFLSAILLFSPRQSGWLEPLLCDLHHYTLYLGAAALTAVTDNAALTTLGAHIPGIVGPRAFALVGGALAGGGLTLLANAPNPIGAAILRSAFHDGVIRAERLLWGACIPTLIALACFWP